ncbi:hypothetical protein OBBRIDRAFT_826411 [Obba rivulosa]|uniref:Uncharacterized protein n=1 Tax=Obba rivulosa TaxID=1052685 RepID=A0A8E2AX36_9APHY|nr:hypothetical protein OBBRIDRAFT_826411 [Obba rivulosa]
MCKEEVTIKSTPRCGRQQQVDLGLRPLWNGMHEKESNQEGNANRGAATGGHRILRGAEEEEVGTESGVREGNYTSEDVRQPARGEKRKKHTEREDDISRRTPRRVTTDAEHTRRRTRGLRVREMRVANAKRKRSVGETQHTE